MSSSTSSSERTPGARRLLGSALGFAASLAAGVGIALGSCGGSMAEAGREELRHRRAEFLEPRRQRPELPLALFLGDSTLMKRWAFPRVLAGRLRERVETQVFAWQGYEAFQHYLILGRLGRLEPRAVVLVAQHRTFYRDEPLWYPDLLDLLPLAELPRALALPFHERGVSLPRLALSSLYGSLGPAGERALALFVGGRLVARETPGLRLLVPVRPPEGDVRALVQVRAERFARYATPIFPDHPAVRMLGAAVDLSRRQGARTLVVVSPIPFERLEAAGLYQRERFEGWVDVLRQSVESAGGELMDLHRLLGVEDFTDDLGHYDARGAARVALRVQPWLEQALDPGS
jgi:hypothetical protein